MNKATHNRKIVMDGHGKLKNLCTEPKSGNYWFVCVVMFVLVMIPVLGKAFTS